MGRLSVVYDASLKLPNIEKLLVTPAPDELPDDAGINMNTVQQTKIDGIMAPLVQLNNMQINFDQIESFTLYCTDNLPSVNMVIHDDFGLIRTIESPTSDNQVQIQIIPPFDNAYKKVNLLFYITSYRSVGQHLHISAVYYVPGIYNSLLESYGKISSYKLCDLMAKKLQLGFVTNVSPSGDERYMYCNNITCIEELSKEIRCGGSEYSILDWWIDWRNNLTLCDIYDRYNADGDVPDIWVDGGIVKENTSFDSDPVPQKVRAVITNLPDSKKSSLYANRYQNILDTSGNIGNGTDKVLLIHSFDTNDASDYLIQDGDIKNDIFTKYEYRGEYFGNYNYLAQQSRNDLYKQKMQSSNIIIHLCQPILGLMRGDRLEFAWYETAPLTQDVILEANNSQEVSNNAPELPDTEDPIPDSMILNKQVSGQYYILGTTLKYSRVPKGASNWDYELRLARPADKTFNYSNKSE